VGKPLDLSVVVPTIGRPRQLAACLESIASCDGRPAEVVVVDQSGGSEIRAVVERFAELGARVVSSSERGVASARNLGLRHAVHEVVLMTDDDCTVDRSWTGTAAELMTPHAALILTGRVLAPGDGRNVPSVKDEATPHDYTGTQQCGVLYTGNMVVSRSAVLEIGAFDETLEAAEDNDLCYRWLSSGRGLRFEPRLVVHHHDWRSNGEVRRLYLRYGRAQGEFYAKHLRRGDRRILTCLRWDLKHLGFALKARVRRRPVSADWRAGYFAGIPIGLVRGWRRYRPGP
jgi:GT2 family glycosyltransferase